MKRRRTLQRVLALLAGAALLGVIGAFALYQGILEQPDATVAPMPDAATVAMESVHHQASRGGRTEWSLDAESAQYGNSKGRAVFDGVKVTFYPENRDPVTVRARQGTLQTDSQDIRMAGDVVVRTGDLELTTESLVYHHGRREITTDAPVRIRGTDIRLDGDALRIDLNTDTARLTGHVKGTFHADISL